MNYMKWLAIVGALLLTLFAAVYVLLFTGFGNDLVSPLIASRLEGKLELNVNVENFELRIGRFALALTLEEKKQHRSRRQIRPLFPIDRCPVSNSL